LLMLFLLYPIYGRAIAHRVSKRVQSPKYTKKVQKVL